MLISIVFFFITLLLLGFYFSKFFKPVEALEKIFISLGIGLSLFILLILLLNQLYLPVNFLIFVFLNLIILIFLIIKKKINLKFSKESIYPLITLVIGLILLFVMIKGSFVYPWLENDDSWDHAEASKYVALYNTGRKSLEIQEAWGRFYLEPYTPTYPLMMGVLHQTNNSINSTLKIFNSILIFLGILFFYLFSKELLNSKTKAVFASFLFAVLPSSMSHFIWSQTLAIVLMLFAFYCIFKIKKEYNVCVFIFAIISSSLVLMTQPSTGIIFGIMFILIWAAFTISETIINKKLKIEKTLLKIGILALILSFIVFWGPTFFKFGFEETVKGMGFSKELVTDKQFDTSQGLIYSISDFLIVPKISKMDQATGWGLFVFISVILGLVLIIITIKKSITKNLIILFWFIFTFIGTQGNAFPIKLFPHRFWVFLAIPVSLLFAEFLMSFLKLRINSLIKIILFLFILSGLIYTSFIPKYIVQTSNWNFGGNFRTYSEIEGYIWAFNNLHKNTYVFNVCGPQEKVIGFDLFSYPLDMDIFRLRKKLHNITTDEFTEFLKNKKYKYLIFDTDCIVYSNLEEINKLISDLPKYLVHKTESFVLLKIL